MAQQINPDGLKIIKHFEGLKLKAYPDPKTGGVPWTIAYGHTQGVQEGMTCTEEQAEQWLLEDLAHTVQLANTYIPGTLTDCEFSAVVSTLFNIGAGSHERDGIIWLKDGQHSTFFKLLTAMQIHEAANELLKWCSPHDPQVTAGLLRRRRAERALFLGEDYEPFLV